MVAVVALSLLFLQPVDPAPPAAVAAPQTLVAAEFPAPPIDVNNAGTQLDPNGVNFDPKIFLGADAADHTCLKIRAFIFKLNDDRAPQFVRETTCLKTRVKMKSVDGAEPAAPALEYK